MKHFPCNKAAAAEKHDECQTADNGRRHGRKQSHHLEETLARHIRVIHTVSENESENDSRRRSNKGREDRVAEYLDELLIRDGAHPVYRCRNEKNFHKRINNKYGKQKEYGKNTDEKRRLPKKHFHLRCDSGVFAAGLFFIHTKLLRYKKDLFL